MKKEHKIILGVVLAGAAIWGIAAFASNKKKQMALQQAKDAAVAASATASNQAGFNSLPTMTAASAGSQSDLDWRTKEL